ncbi:hypothetical protein IFO70_28260 [Phormidium tenue FACHB-886]|nr:hypothetical protein [Phormidium tenue FACHB-886]
MRTGSDGDRKNLFGTVEAIGIAAERALGIIVVRPVTFHTAQRAPRGSSISNPPATAATRTLLLGAIAQLTMQFSCS